MAKVFTVKELFRMCSLEIANGNADAKIYISSDDEGNSFHPLYFGFTSSREALESFCSDQLLTVPAKPEELIILG